LGELVLYVNNFNWIERSNELSVTL
jgi:hypothetical protein